MKKYIYKQPIEACQYKKGMETGWYVKFDGHLYENYIEKFETEQEAFLFISYNEGINKVDLDDTKFNIIYKNPRPYLIDVINKFLPIEHDDDYIVRYPTGRIEILSKEKFETLFKLHEDERKYDKFGLPLKLNSIPMPTVKKPKNNNY